MLNKSNRRLTALPVAALAALFAVNAFAADSFDSDSDGFDDNSDNCTLVANADQRDTNGDGFGNLCDPDVNNNNIVDGQDFRFVRWAILNGGNPNADFDGDGNVDGTDIGILVDMAQQPPGPTGTDPDVPNCNCYFSGDCTQSGQFCDWGDEGFTIELSCWWRDPKPTAPGNGCSTEYEGEWGPICDGFCTDSRGGSSIGGEQRTAIAQAARLWADAMITPSLRGGGPVDQALADAARALPFQLSQAADVVGRHAADMIGIAAGRDFYDFFCHFEHHPQEPDASLFVDLTQDSCRIEAAALTADALVAEIETKGAAREILAGIPASCAGWQDMFAPRCEAGPDALNCFSTMVEDLAHFMTTPRAQVAKANDFIDEVMGRR